MDVKARIEVKVPAAPTTPGLTCKLPVNDNGITKSTKS